MNQILAIGNKNGRKNNNNSTVDLKKIILFFSVAIIIFGAIMLIKGIVGISKNKKQENVQVPSVMITPNLDNSPTPMEQGDTESPIIEISLRGEIIRIVATDDEELDYIKVLRNDEIVDIINADDGSDEIETTLEIQPGSNVIKVVAVDKAENSTEKIQEFVGKIRPKVELGRLEDGVRIIAECEEGLNKLTYKINGEWMLEISFEQFPNATKEDWAASGVIVDFSEDGKIVRVEYVEKRLQPGTNKFEVYAYSTSNLPGEMTSYTEN